MIRFPVYQYGQKSRVRRASWSVTLGPGVMWRESMMPSGSGLNRESWTLSDSDLGGSFCGHGGTGGSPLSSLDYLL